MRVDRSLLSSHFTGKPFSFRARLAFVIFLGAGGIALSPAAAKAVGTIANVMTSCSSSTACIGGKNSGAGAGVVGTAKSSSGVSGTTSYVQPNGGVDAAGVFGNNTGSGFGGIGVLGQGTYGVYGAGTFYGAYGHLASTVETGYGIVGNDGSYDGGYGLGAHANYGVAANLQQSAGNAHDTLQLVGGQNYGGSFQQLINAQTNDDVSVMTLDDAGNIVLKGKIKTDGTCKNVCIKSKVRSYAPRESVLTMEDFGEAKLVGGRAQVALDPAFANVIDTNASYSVLITPEGESNGLYVAQRTSHGFAVREKRGGLSSLAFSYRIVAKPFGDSDPRLPTITDAVQRSTQLPTIGNPSH